MEEQIKKDEELAKKLQQEECDAAGELGKAVAASLADLQKPSFISAEQAVASDLIPDPKAKPKEKSGSSSPVLQNIHGSIDPNKSPILKSKSNNRRCNYNDN